MVDNATNSTTFTNWTKHKAIATLVRKEWQQHENVYLKSRGTGLHNYNSSYIYVDDNTILYHSAFIGLFLCILDRRDLSIAHADFYNTS